jgi:hypothetical protein
VIPETLGVTVAVRVALAPSVRVVGARVRAVLVETCGAVIVTVTGEEDEVRLVSPA